MFSQYITSITPKRICLFYVCLFFTISLHAQNLCDYEFSHKIPVRIILPPDEIPSPNYLSNIIKNWQINLQEDKEYLPMKLFSDLKIEEEYGEYCVTFRIPCNYLPVNKTLKIRFLDKSEIFEPTKSSSFSTSTENLKALKMYTKPEIFLRHYRYSIINVKNKNLTCDFSVDGKSIGSGNSQKIIVDPKSRKNSLTVKIESIGYETVSLELKIDNIGLLPVIPVRLLKKEQFLQFEKVAYLYQNGYYKKGLKLLKKLKEETLGRWGYLELYGALFENYTGDRQNIIPICNKIISRAKYEKDFLLEAEAILLKTEMFFNDKRYREVKNEVKNAVKALKREIKIYGASRMIPPYSTPQLEYKLKYFSCAAESELFLASKLRMGNKDELLTEWQAFRDETNKRVPDVVGKQLLTVNPYEGWVKYYETRIKNK